MLPYPEPSFCLDANSVDSSAAALQTQCAVLDASTEVHLALPLPPSVSTHLRKFTQLPKGSDSARTAEMGFEKRNREFAVGRHCAHAALNQLGITADVPADVDRKPIWPNGIAGSISHSHNFAWAAVAKQDSVKSIGIDTEIVVDDRTIRQVAKEITVDAEQRLMSKIHGDVKTAFTVVFSAKESIYKCLYPLNAQFFGFHDVLLVEATDQTVTFAQQPSNPNYAIAPHELIVRFAIHQNDVFSTIWI